MNSLPKKSLGQHWLKDDAALDAIVALAELNEFDTVLEIGPGQGDLTRKLVPKAHKIIAVEKDEQLAEQLTQNSPLNLQVIKGDILKFDLTTLHSSYKVVANIPYYLTNNLLRILCESPNPPSTMVLLLQKEVAERVAAKAGQMSLLSVSVQYYCEVELGPIVRAELFTPPPKVDSQVIKLTYRQKPLFAEVDKKQFFRVVKAGFVNRRKTLLNSLSAGLHLPKEQTAKVLKKAGINPAARAQELSLEQWHKLYKTVPTD